MSIDLVRNIVP